MSEVLRVRLPKGNGAKDPNDFEERDALKDVVREVIEEAEKTKRGAFPFLYAHELDGVESDSYLIDRWVPAAGVHVMYAKKDCLKSFIAVDWFLSVASGEPWKGHDVEQGLCIYIAGEGNRGLRRRMKAWAIRNQVDLKVLPIALSKWPMQALDVENIRQWSDYIAAVEEHYGRPAKFIVVDTLATNFGPGEENSSTDMAQFLAHLSIYLKRDTDATVLVVHHTGKDAERGARGGYSIEANAEAVYEVTRVEVPGQDWDRTVELRVKHLKDDDAPPLMVLKGNAVELGTTDRHGDPMTSLVLDIVLSEQEQAVLNQTNAGRSQRQIAEFLGHKSATPVNRIVRRLRAMGMLT